MKRILTVLLLVPGLVFGAANDLLINQRNATDTGTLSRTVTIPAGGANGIFGFNGSTVLPMFYTVGSGLTLTGGVLDAVPGGPVTWASITGKPTFATVSTSGAYADLSGIPALAPVAIAGTYSSLTGIPSTFTPSAHNQAWSTITSTPTTLGGYGITDAYPLTGNPSAFITQSGARSAISLTTTGTSGAATYNNATGVLNVPTYANSGGTVTSVTAGTGLNGGTITTTGTISMPNTGTPGTYQNVTTDAQGRVTSGQALSINDAPARSPVTSTTATGYQISATRAAYVCYEGSFSTTSTIGGPSGATVFLETADTNSTTAGDWTTKATQTYSNNITLAIVLNQVQGNNWSMCRFIPAGKYVRIRSGSVTGTASVTLNSTQQETLY
jgi:hypothetical protein